MLLTYRDSKEAWDEYESTIVRLIRESGAKRICDVGGGANPVLPLETVRELDLEYTVLDISAEELEKAPSDYLKLVADITAAEPPAIEAFDLVFSKMLAEHVRDAERFHRNVNAMLKPGGLAFHFFPTLYAFPFLLNVLIPESFTGWLLRKVMPHRTPEGKHAKFPAHYRWCRGPMAGQLRRLRSTGFEVAEYHSFYGHDGYYKRLGPLLALHSGQASLLRRMRSKVFTSFAYVVLRKG